MKTKPQEETLFDAARNLTSPTARQAFLDQACADDPELRMKIEALLAAEQDAESFFNDVATGIVVPAAVSHAGLPATDVEIDISEIPGTHIGRYKLLQRIGEGGGGVVYMAEQEEPVRRRVALKIIKLGMDTKSVIARFEAERQALAMMDHPNIARVFDAGATETGRPYFVMELVRGVRITEYCDQNQLDTRGRLDLFIQICQAIQHAHQKGDHSSRHQAVEHPRDAARRRAGAEGDRFRHRQGDRGRRSPTRLFSPPSNRSSARPPT